MKKFKLITVLFLILSGAALSAEEFDWSECWCNYGAGLKQGDVLVTAGGGLYFSDLTYAALADCKDYWFIPPVMLEVQFVQPIWKLPFTFGGYAGLHAYHYDYIDHYEGSNPVYKSANYWGVFVGGEAAYHIQLPPKTIDIYAVTRVGGNIPIVRPGRYWDPDYFYVGEALGVNWLFAKNFGFNLEVGYPFSKIGVTLKF